MKQQRQRKATWVLAAVPLVLAFCLAMVLSAAVFFSERSLLNRDILAAQTYLDAWDLEMLGVRAALGAMVAEPCSDQALRQMRQIEMTSQYVVDIIRKDAEGGGLCSSTLGRQPISYTRRQSFDLRLSRLSPPISMIELAPGPDEFGSINPFLVEAGDYYLSLNDRLLQKDTLTSSQVTYVASLGTIDLKPLIGARAGPDASLIPAGLRSGPLSQLVCRDGSDICVFAERLSDPLWSAIGWIAPVSLFGGSIGGLLLVFGGRRLLRHWGALSQRLRRAARDGELYVLYQPVVDLYSGRIRGAEALVRWRDREGREVRPDVVARLAEDAGAARLITDFVVSYSLRHFWRLNILSDLPVSFNVSARELTDPGFVDHFKVAISETGIARHLIGFEISGEDNLDIPGLQMAIGRLRDNGFRLTLDDFGAGQETVSLLERLSFDCVKIDRLFGQSAGQGTPFGSLLPRLIDMAKSRGFEIAAEGVESESGKTWLRDKGVFLAQGYFFAPPLTPDAFAALCLSGGFVLTGEDAAEDEHTA